jgi:hypothetical protein
MSMKMVVEYLEYARNLERLAAHETNPDLKAVFERQAAAYRARAACTAKKRQGIGAA